MMRTLRAATIAGLLVAASACSTGSPNLPAARPAPAPAADSLSPLAIRPGDVIRVMVWGHPELSGEFPIDENYNLLYPLLGAINVRTLSVAQLRDQLNTQLSQLFQRPFLTLTPLFRVGILGEVQRPGLYPVDPTLTVFDLIALAGGPTRQANEKRLQLLRGGASIRVSLDPAAIARSTLQELGVHSGDQLVMPRAAFTRDDLGLILQIASFVLLVYTVLRK
jgi:protein involved in polysaccharide export with SLBB domain